MVDALSNLNKLAASVGNVGAAGAGGAPAAEGAASPDAASSFKDVLLKNLNDVNQMQQDADSTLENYVTGKTENVGEVISASQKAGMAFSMLVQIRNKLQDAYDELKNLRV